MKQFDITTIVWTGIITYSMIQGILLFLIFPTYRNGKKQAKWILAVASLLCSILLIEGLFDKVFGYTDFPHLIFTAGPVWYAISPVIFLYIRLYSTGRGVTIRDFWHFIPSLWVFVSTIEFYSLDAEIKLYYFEQASNGNVAPIHNLNFIIYSIQSISYLVVSGYLLRKYESFKKIEGKLLIQLTAILGLIAVFSVTSVFFMNNFAEKTWWSGSLYFVVISMFLLMLFINSIKAPHQLYLVGRPILVKPNGINPELSESYQNMLNYLKSDKPYIDPAFDIQTLAKDLGYSKHFVAQLIKESTGLNFRDYMNKFRLEEAKKKLNSPLSRQFTIQSIANDSGFNSVATFYRAFKKLEGKTPKAFIP
ncbi:MAG: helix-turn-helix domain-containing protein [bacterium]|nr:helix-turn-helix domain-containing protein [bacterium]